MCERGAAEKYVGNPCTREENCGACVRADPQCAWCSAEVREPFHCPTVLLASLMSVCGHQSFSQETSSHRCDYHGNLITKCDPGQLVYPSHRLEKIVSATHYKYYCAVWSIQDDELSNKGALEGQAIQIKPQEIKLRLRPGSPFPLQVEFRQAEDYPVDLYYLMDLSKSMEDDKDKLATLGDLLAEHMGNITSNFRLGFGSFVDKVVMPYVSTVPEKLKQPCPGCAAPYGFLNHMPLSDKTKIFSNKVKDARVSGNLDAPEGGFDAIMQAVVCEKQIAWRNNSRRMLLFSSDSGFHFAGDGKLGGIVKPNDGLCHLDNQGYYTESIHQDYPSISQLNHKIQEKKVNIIFAVTASQVPVYERLSARLEASSTGRLENDSSNIVQLVQEQYDVSHHNASDNLEDKSYVKVSYYSSCLGDKKEKTQVCKGLKVGTHVKFEAQIEVLRCPEDASKWNQTFIIYPEGLNEGLTVNLEMVCDCPCEKPWAEERNSPKCSDGHGTYECGICSCYNNRYGDNCQCDAKDNDPAIIEASCYKSNDSKPCSGRGSCHCGKCACDNYPVVSYPLHMYQLLQTHMWWQVWGKHCECDDLACDRHDNKMCSGPDHGYCKCGECICLDGWMGEVCDCRNTTDTCYAPGSEQICSGHGYCDCGKCHCFETGEEHFSGEFCEECPTCPGKCELFKECVQCRTFESGPLSEAECNNCSFFPVKTDKLEIKDPDREKLCIFRDDDDCKFMFTYAQDEKNPGIYLVRVQVTKDCPEPINLLAILLGVIVGIVAVGVALLLLWKLLTVIHDRREFAKFEKERENAKWDTGENPIYKQATSTFKNPTYGGKQLKQPCPGCAAPYGFLNHMPLSDKTKIFSNKVKDARVSGNLDAPEGGFDAIMQAVVCEKQIAWRNNSRRMLLFSSDSGFHFAGDGKKEIHQLWMVQLGGIVKPNDGLCHLDNQGYYTESIHQDYPSISQLNHKIQEKKVNIIFAVTASQVPVYERLSARLEASSTGRLENDSSNIVQLVQEQYDKITSSVVLTDNLEDKSYVKVSYYSSCLGDKKEKTQVCKGLKVGTHVKFEAQIEVLRCPEDASKWNQTFIIYPEGLNEGLTVNLEMVCDCPCEKPWAEERNSPKCSDGHGTYECGICSCYNNRYGDNCQCDAKDNDPAIIEASCYKSNDSKPCSGRGSCHCGKCACDNYPVVWGKHCECDDLACDRHDNKMCSGPDHGYCKCGECICLDGWMGEVCDCRNTTDTCYAPGSEQICSGHGYCDCGKCHCFETGEEHFSGEFCEECPTCPGKCELFKECVQCRTFESGPLSEAECNNCSFFPVKTDKLEIKDPDREKLCIFRDDDDCKFMFTYAQDEKNPGIYLVRVQVTKDCPEPINLLAILLGVIVGIVAVGVALLLLWKLLTVIHDRREFAKFEKERENAKWDTGENPIYKQATSTFKNPTYGGKQ
ncbi:ITGB1 [Cordylochernes scorpioides]|uniref:Integrin beta n=1 Tax=Cordylochernes scorpioides TaxID=51811 RepID=A0ABY6L947_9ARAC|nr:ITGB1 [Cordylochernes scorpioides]